MTYRCRDLLFVFRPRSYGHLGTKAGACDREALDVFWSGASPYIFLLLVEVVHECFRSCPACNSLLKPGCHCPPRYHTAVFASLQSYSGTRKGHMAFLNGVQLATFRQNWSKVNGQCPTDFVVQQVLGQRVWHPVKKDPCAVVAEIASVCVYVSNSLHFLAPGADLRFGGLAGLC